MKQRIIGSPEDIKLPQCYGCVHYRQAFSCAAFQEIPERILHNFHDHRQPYPGDNGIQYEPIEQPATTEAQA